MASNPFDDPRDRLRDINLSGLDISSPLPVAVPGIGPVNAPSARELLSLGMFVFGMDSVAYSELTRRTDWRHALSERHGARAASQYVGPGLDTISMGGLLVPEIGGRFADLDRLIEMADTGDHWPLVEGTGKVLGKFRIIAVDQKQKAIMAGGIPRAIDFTIDLERAD